MDGGYRIVTSMDIKATAAAHKRIGEQIKNSNKDALMLAAVQPGTGQVLGAVQAGYNDIGILTAPDGRSYAVAVMIKRTSTPLPTRMALMNNVVRAVIDNHQARTGGTYTL